MTHLYYVRHAQPDYSVHDDLTRPLTEKGMRDCALVTDFLTDKSIDRVFSSPYKRAVDTVQPFAAQAHLPVTLIDDLRERRIDSVWIDDFESFCKAQWADFDYRYKDGECLREVQERNIEALQKNSVDLRRAKHRHRRSRHGAEHNPQLLRSRFRL